jgi:dolichol-phosphate mannosyltransferase
VKISIIIPIYNEFASLPEVLRGVLSAPLPEGCSKEVIVVDDGSNDGTAFLLNEYVVQGGVLVHHVLLNGGKGAAIRTGLTLASGEVILIQDGDLEYDPKDYVRLLAPIVNGEAAVVYGSRFHGGAPGMQVLNLVANKILTFVANALYGANITDEATAYKAFRADTLRQLVLKCGRFEFCPEITAKLCRLGYRIDEVPVSYHARTTKEGKKIRSRDGVRALWTLLKYRLVPRQSFVHPVVAILERPAPSFQASLAGADAFRKN